MAHKPIKKATTLSSWLLWKPMQFALTSFLLIIATIFIYILICSLFFDNYTSKSTLTIFLSLAIAASTYLSLKKMPKDNINRKSFVAINNAQLFLISSIFILSTITIIANAEKIILKMLWLSSHNNIGLVFIFMVVSLFYLYLCGLFLSNVYAKYRRCRSLGLSPIKILCTMPFGFGLLWIPGYILPEQQKKNETLHIHTKWYNKLTDWILYKKINTIISFTIITIFSGFFFGFNMTLITFVLAIMFAIWSNILGQQKFQNQISQKYTSFAIIVNIILLITIILTVSISSAPGTANINMHINDISNTVSIK